MDKQFGLYIVLEMLIGAVFGASFHPFIGNSALGVLGGALAGVFMDGSSPRQWTLANRLENDRSYAVGVSPRAERGVSGSKVEIPRRKKRGSE